MAGNTTGESSGQWLDQNEVENLLYAGFLGVFLGGRIGYVLFYNFPQFMADPLYLFRVWDGGMSFHGGLIGVIVVMIIFARRTKRSFFRSLILLPHSFRLVLVLGAGNFINGELWGRVDPNFPFAMLFHGSRTEDILLLQTNPQWQSIFDTYGVLPRHPSQLYELLLEGVVLFIILNLYIRKPRPMGAVSGLFLIGYGAFRIIVEFSASPTRSLLVLGAVHQHGANSFHPDDCRGCDHDGLGISSQPTATRFLRNHETVFRTDAKVLDEGTQKNDRTGTGTLSILVIRCVLTCRMDSRW